MKYSLLLALALVAVLLPSAHALTLAEQSLAASGFTGLSIQNGGPMTCTAFTFIPFDDYMESGNDTLLSLTWELAPISEMDANVIVKDDQTDEVIKILTPHDRMNTGRVHVEIPKTNIHTPTTRIQLCGAPSATTELLRIDADATIGLYQQPRFDGLTNFQTIVAGNHPLLGEEIPIQVSLTNTGAQAADVSIVYRKYDLPYIPLLKGETGFQGTIQPGEQKIITYLIKPLRAVQILLPPAILTYTNVFGEVVTQESTRAYLEVAAPQFNVNGAFLVPQTQVSVHEPVNVRWVAKNEGIAPIEGLNATFFVKPSGSIVPNSAAIERITPSESQSRDFTLTFERAGTYEVGCVLTTSADPTLTTNCSSAKIEVVENNTFLPLAFSVLLLLIAIGVYAYISMAPKAREPEKPKRGRFHSE